MTLLSGILTPARIGLLLRMNVLLGMTIDNCQWCVKYLLTLSIPSEFQPQMTNGFRHVIDTGGTPADKSKLVLDFIGKYDIIHPVLIWRLSSAG